MLVPRGGRHARRIQACVATIGLVAGSSLLGASDLPGIPAPVREKMSEFHANTRKAVIVRTKDGPWLVAAASGNASTKVPAVMLHDSATRAAIVEAKRRMAELLSAEIATYVAASTDDTAPMSFTRNVTVAVSGQVLSRVQLIEENYNPATKQSHVIVASAPADKAVGHDIEFPDAETAARHMLERCGHGLASPGVICTRIVGSTPQVPRLAFIAIAVGPRSANGRSEVALAKAQASLARFWSETLESRVDLEQREIPDPDDPQGSRLLNYEHIKEWAKSRQDLHVLPPFKSLELDREDVSYTAIWCTN